MHMCIIESIRCFSVSEKLRGRRAGACRAGVGWVWLCPLPWITTASVWPRRCMMWGCGLLCCGFLWFLCVWGAICANSLHCLLNSCRHGHGLYPLCSIKQGLLTTPPSRHVLEDTHELYLYSNIHNKKFGSIVIKEVGREQLHSFAQQVGWEKKEMSSQLDK